MTPVDTRRAFARKMDTIGWAIFFVWVGVAVLAGISWAWSLIGTGIIILAVQSVLLLRGEAVDMFMSAVGLVLVGGAVAGLYGSPWSLVPAFLIVIGLVMIADTLRPRRES